MADSQVEGQSPDWKEEGNNAEGVESDRVVKTEQEGPRHVTGKLPDLSKIFPDQRTEKRRIEEKDAQDEARTTAEDQRS